MISAPTTAFTGSIPENYDRYLGPVLFEPYALDLVNRLPNDSLKNVLEIACGTGRVTNHLVNLLTDDGKLIATDLNADMIAIAKQKVISEKITWQVVDAQELPFEDETFDHIVCQFGVMFFPDKPKAFKEAYRVLQKGGRYLFNTWSTLAKNPRSELVQKILVEVMGDDAPDFMDNAPFSMHDPNAIKYLIEAAGFHSVQVDTVQKQTVYGNNDDVLEGYLKGSPLAAFLSKVDTNLREKIETRLRQEVADNFSSGKFETMEAIVCSAYK
jgi:ubiquinone/menaquinone biosynthesis C-methylase UbiE